MLLYTFRGERGNDEVYDLGGCVVTRTAGLVCSFAVCPSDGRMRRRTARKRCDTRGGIKVGPGPVLRFVF